MMARDTSARPGDLLQVKIGDIKIKRAVGGSSSKIIVLLIHILVCMNLSSSAR
jgi:hypothetical protein